MLATYQKSNSVKSQSFTHQPQSKSRLTAMWVKENNQLICKWVIT